MSTIDAAPQWTGYVGPDDQTEIFGAPIRRCPTCSGSGRVVDSEQLKQAWRDADERSRVSGEAWILVLQAEEAVLHLLREDPQKAKGLAGDVGRVAAAYDFITDEESLRHDFLHRMRRLKQELGDKITWEDLRQVTARLRFSGSRPGPKFMADWRAFRMACRRAQPLLAGQPRALRRVFNRRKGWVYQWEPLKQLPDGLERNMKEVLDQRLKRARDATLGKRLARLLERWEDLVLVGTRDDPVDGPVLQATYQLLQRAAKSRVEQGRNGPKMLDRAERLLRMLEKREEGLPVTAPS